MQHPEYEYLNVLRRVAQEGVERENGTDKQDAAYQE